MKPTLLITLSFLLFAFITIDNIPLAFSQQVVDTNANPIFPGGRYHILPATRVADGGGVRPGTTTGQTCPVTVLQDYSADENGAAATLTSTVKPGIIFPGTLLDIEFEEKPECAESSKWVVVFDAHGYPKPYVGIGGVRDHPGKDILSGRFNLQKYDFGYKLVFCPASTTPRDACFDIGRENDEDGRRLVLADGHPDPVLFIDVDVIYGNSLV